MGIWMGPLIGDMKKETDFIYTGSYSFAAEDGHWEIALKSSGTLTFKRKPGIVDIFMVGGGKPGNAGSGSKASPQGGTGGDGGECITKIGEELVKETGYAAVIGGSNEATTFKGYTARTGEGSQGASESNNGADGVLAFGDETMLLAEFSGHKFGPGGGGGASGSTVSPTTSAGKGGESNGDGDQYGHGAYVDGTATPGLPNHGGGGGGAYIWFDDSGTGYGSNSKGDGASGVIFIRDHRG